MTGIQKSATHPRNHHDGLSVNYYIASVTFTHKLTPFFVFSGAPCCGLFQAIPQNSPKPTQVRQNSLKKHCHQKNPCIESPSTPPIRSPSVANGCCQNSSGEHIVSRFKGYSANCAQKWPGRKPKVRHNGQDKCGWGRKDEDSCSHFSPAGARTVAHAPSETPSGRPRCAGYAG